MIQIVALKLNKLKILPNQIHLLLTWTFYIFYFKENWVEFQVMKKYKFWFDHRTIWTVQLLETVADLKLQQSDGDYDYFLTTPTGVMRG